MTGTVAPNSHGGQPLIQTSLGLLALQTDAPLPPGARITLAPLADTQTLPPDMTTDAAGTPDQAPGAAFEAAIGFLPQADPRPVADTLSPQPPATVHWTAVLLGLTAAVDSGSIRSWLGAQKVAALEKGGKKPLLERLDREMSTLKSPIHMPMPGDWQSMILPLPIGDRIERIRMIVRRPPDDEKEAQARDEEGTRFLLDLTLSNMGAMQLDGLLRRKSRRFDLILRSHDTLPDPVRRDIAEIFSRSIDGFGLSGQATFQQTTKFIEPIPAPGQGTAGMIFA
ncbi:MAG: hypothetical protein F8N37_22360 [Telmatospirillum sp.]|nr:hypothetical protein [Telmatospirillum sp.]